MTTPQQRESAGSIVRTLLRLAAVGLVCWAAWLAGPGYLHLLLLALACWLLAQLLP